MQPIPTALSSSRAPIPAQAGFSVFEVLIGASILAVALLGHTASLFSEQKLSVAERARSAALQAGEQFMERLRSDDDFAGLYGRLLAIQEPPGGTAPSNHVVLRDATFAYPPQVFQPDFVVPTGIESLHVAVRVPAAPTAGGPSVFREDLHLANLGLPADVNGDGMIDDQDHADDYRVIPVHVTLRWTTTSAAVEEVSMSSWLWGYR